MDGMMKRKENLEKCYQNKAQRVINLPVLLMGIMVRVFADGLGDLGSIPDRVIPKTEK